MAIKKEILDEELKKALAERVLNAEMDHHLADSTQDEVSEGEKAGNRRNGFSKKTVLPSRTTIQPTGKKNHLPRASLGHRSKWVA